MVECALARGHAVTLFNRGSSGPLPPGVDFVCGDREKDLELLAGRRFDSVIDTCGHLPRLVRASLKVLTAAVDHYAYISSISAYAEPLGGTFAEEEPVIALPDPSIESITNETYGGLKALCEHEVRDAMRDRALVVRPGLIVGPLDPTDRFTYWPSRFALGGDVLVAGSPDSFVSFVDVRDLARWIVRAVEAKVVGTFNASGEYGATTMGDVIDACMRAAGAGTPVWVDEQFLISAGVTAWTEMPLWVPVGEDTLLRTSSAKAVACGLTYRPLEDTVAATLEWSKRQGLDRPLRAGITRDREASLLRARRVRNAPAS
jgi:2'-hydroxyisoflavone reductase